MKVLKSYSQILESIRERVSITEMALNPDRLDNLKRFKDAGDISSSLKLIKPTLDRIINICKDTNYDDIVYSYKNDIVKISFNSIVFVLLATLKNDLNILGDEIQQRIFGDVYDDIYLEVELDKDLLNKIDIMNGLPNFMKGIGLGKKIYKKLIKDFGFISSFNGYEPSLDSSMVWRSLATDSEIFTFTNDENIISFWNDLNYDLILEKLKLFYEQIGDIQIDNDFLKKYELSEEEFIDKLQSV
jgi:hypothetical protein